MLALSGTMLVGCTQSEYIGDAPQQNGNEIVFSGASGKMTRATSNEGTVAQKLDGQIKFYGVKKTATTDDAATYADVFQNYILWSQGGATTSNPDGDWEYVGPDTQTYGSENETIGKAQTIKYWDYSTDEYHFVAGSPVKAFEYALKDGEIATATVTGIAGHLNPNNGTTAIDTDPIYIAAPVKVAKANYKEDVVFSFTRQQSFVRVGLFETIPGYAITAIKFYKMDENGKWTTTPGDNNNITLASATKEYFTGATDASATITYKNWDSTPTFEFAYDNGTEFVQQNNWYGGKLEKGVPATTSTNAVYGTDGDMATTGYFTVIPTTSELDAAPLLVKCDYELTSVEDGSKEIINVTGATAAIPAAYTKWAPNTSYTYLFKISDNTNGTTGGGSGPEGLFPITFDAAVVEVEDGTAQGTVTTVSTPSITTYQEGFAAAMKYVANKPIYVTAQNDETGALYDLTDKVKVFKLDDAKTEADLILTAPEETSAVTDWKVGTGETVGAVTYKAGKYGSFTPAAGYYAIQYMTKAAEGSTPASYAYKVVCVE